MAKPGAGDNPEETDPVNENDNHEDSHERKEERASVNDDENMKIPSWNMNEEDDEYAPGIICSFGNKCCLGRGCQKNVEL